MKVNPLDLPVGDTRPDVLTRRGLFLHTLIGILLGQAPPPAERAALDRAIIAVYRQAGITSDPATHHRPAPLLKDLVATLEADSADAGRELAGRLTPWVAGSFSDLFDGPTTTRPDGHLVVWSLRHLPDELRTVGTLLALDAIWRSVDTPGRARLAVRRLVVVDEAWLLLRDGEGARFLLRMSKASRKRNAGLTVITQDVADVLATDVGQAVVSNAATQVLLKQAPQAIDAVADAFGLTAGERRMLLAAPVGHGLLICGPHRTAFESIASKTEHRYATTTPSDLVDLDGLNRRSLNPRSTTASVQFGAWSTGSEGEDR